MTTSDPALLDVNILLALILPDHVHHLAAHDRFPSVEGSWATTPITECALIRLLLTEALVGRRVSGAEALDALRSLRALPGWRWLADDVSLAEGRIDTRVLVGRRQVTDLHLVQLAARHGVKLHTFDSGIARALAPKDRPLVEVWAV